MWVIFAGYLFSLVIAVRHYLTKCHGGVTALLQLIACSGAHSYSNRNVSFIVHTKSSIWLNLSSMISTRIKVRYCISFAMTIWVSLGKSRKDITSLYVALQVLRKMITALLGWETGNPSKIKDITWLCASVHL